MKKNKNKKTLGIIGGFGPESTADFYLKIIESFKKTEDCYPEIFIYNTPITFEMENTLIKSGNGEKNYLKYIKNGIKKLENIKEIDYYVIPCNTIHCFIKKIQKYTNKKFINIIDETISFIKKNNFKKIGILCTTATLKSRIYQNGFKKKKISYKEPTEEQQDKISKIIFNILNNKKNNIDKKYLISIIKYFKKNDCDCVILACTDLQILLKKELNKKDFVFDTLDILTNATINYIK